MASKFDEDQIKMFINFIENEKRLLRGSSSETELKSYIKKMVGEYCENSKN